MLSFAVSAPPHHCHSNTEVSSKLVIIEDDEKAAATQQTQRKVEFGGRSSAVLASAPESEVTCKGIAEQFKYDSRK